MRVRATRAESVPIFKWERLDRRKAVKCVLTDFPRLIPACLVLCLQQQRHHRRLGTNLAADDVNRQPVQAATRVDSIRTSEGKSAKIHRSSHSFVMITLRYVLYVPCVSCAVLAMIIVG